MKRSIVALALGIALATTLAQAQQMYRWVDNNGRTHVTDTPPPPGARSVQKSGSAAAAADPAKPAATGQVPFELQRLQQRFPVTLYTAPKCQEACSKAREALNKRGVPFKEVLVWQEETFEELKRVAGATEVPTIVVGTTVERGFLQTNYDALLDSAGYPKEGVLPVRSQAAPATPADYTPPAAPAGAQPVKPAAAQEAAAPTGPYAPGAPPQQRRSQKK